MNIVIIGGGPCGIMAGIRAKELNKNNHVILLEKNDSIGKRIKASGNGRCNFSNVNFAPNKYNHPEFIKGYEKEKDILKNYLNKVGLYYFHDEEGRIYPNSENGNTFLYVLKRLLEENKVDIRTNEEVIKIKKENEKYIVYTKNNEYIGDKIVLSIGGASFNYQKENYYNVVKCVTNDIVTLTPSLTPIITSNVTKKMEGKRIKANVKLLFNNKIVKEEKGEVLFKKDGVSGIVIFNISTFLARLHLSSYQGYTLSIDMLPNLTIEEVDEYIKKDHTLRNLLQEDIALEINKRKMHPKNFILDVISLYELKNSQVTSGGVNISTLDERLFLKNDNNIFIGGETIDIDGECGGYNIEFALLSGIRIGSNL